LISSSERRVLDELDPNSTQSGRNRQPIHDQAAGSLTGEQASSLRVSPISPRAHPQPINSAASIHGQARKRFANPQPGRLAFQLEARLMHSTIFTNVSRHNKQLACCAELEARKVFSPSARLTGSWQTFQETPDTQWQKN
jgi:hypothetical protein